MSKDITIYDIAKDAGLSPATVSRALNDHPTVREKTKSKIFKIASKLGYQSNIFAANLRTNRSNNIGVIVPMLDSKFQASVIAGMETVASEAGFNLLISQSLNSQEKELANVHTMFKSRVDGLLVSQTSNEFGTQHFKPFFRKNIPVIFYDRVGNCDNCLGIVIDNVNAAYTATKHLLEQGYKRIFHVLGSEKIDVYRDRLKGYKLALIENHIAYNGDLVMFSKLSEDACEDIIEKMQELEQMPDALFVSNDGCAANCIQVLKSKGICVPDDIAVVGFNNDGISRLVEPNLTTINYPGQEMGEIAMKSLLQRLEDPSSTTLNQTEKISLRSELIIRDSSVKK
ncbi:LacI family transcriptional regulator [Indibacter alkaliphilus LW1]|uniref:LacI family transcriptional regulator n=1 Tax=Indibacter alkaliphilus (strain CCUG 57479 / KCTC 22604 / LW1) TaxID=1189612 RepID=S2DSH6_INDAL|nr:LacI family DNA-binding transcriptional regulator [Indibacter alkaliphilus]EOZ92823.1 LacI family transcriptional regulator [Indibacter alkaliphilus LW1]